MEKKEDKNGKQSMERENCYHYLKVIFTQKSMKYCAQESKCTYKLCSKYGNECKMMISL